MIKLQWFLDVWDHGRHILRLIDPEPGASARANKLREKLDSLSPEQLEELLAHLWHLRRLLTQLSDITIPILNASTGETP